MVETVQKEEKPKTILRKGKGKVPPRWVALPPCGLSDIVKFGKTCPYSKHKSCKDCIMTDWDLECIKFLRDSDHFGLA